LSDTTAGNHPCYRYEFINKNIVELESTSNEINLLQISNTFKMLFKLLNKLKRTKSVELYTGVINIGVMEFVLSYKLSNEKY
jgi:choloylglycine hydrolase